MKRLYVGTLVALAVLSGPSMSAGAPLVGEIHGVVSGPQGPLDGLTVNIINGNGSVLGTAVTSSAGTYTVANLAVGTYTVQVVDRAGAVLATGMGTVTAAARASAVDLTFNSSGLAAAALVASKKKAIVLGVAAAAAVGTLIFIATRPDSSPTR